MSKIIVLLVVFVLLNGCSESGPEGKYTCNGMLTIKLDFRGDGQGFAKVMGTETAFEYKLDGEKLIMTGNGEANVLTIKDDTLVGNPAIGTCTPG